MSKYSLKNPPLNEVVFGIQFKGGILTSKRIHDIYNKCFAEDYPEIKEEDKLPSIVEQVNGRNVQLLNSRESRKQFIHKDDDKVIQIQPDKLLFNWRKGLNLREYPHFESTYKQFLDNILENEEFSNYLGHINQYELTYFDHIESYSFKEGLYDVSSIFNWFNIKSNPRNIDFSFSLYNNAVNGNISVNIKSAIRRQDNKPIIVFETTVRGYVEKMTINNWFMNARKLIVDLFFDSISEKTIRLWK